MYFKDKFWFVFLFLVSLTAEANLKADIKHLVESVDPSVNIGVHVEDAKTGQVLYSQNADRYFLPASVLKIVTDAIALDVLGPNFTFKTQILKGAKKGQVILRFSGDPILTFQDLVLLFKHLKAQKVSQVVIDTRNTFPIKTSPGAWPQEIMRYCYATPVHPLMINRNSVSFKVDASKVGSNATITVDPDSFVKIKGALPKVAEKCDPRTQFEREHMSLAYPIVTLEPACQEVAEKSLGMCLPVVENQNTIYIKDMVAKAFLQSRDQKNGWVDIVFRELPANKEYAVLAEHNSQPLFIFMKKAMVDSDNLIMDRLMMEVSTRLDPTMQQDQEIGQMIAKWAESRLKLDLSKVIIGDGAGLGRYNQVTPAQLAGLLRSIYQDPAFYALYYQTFPEPGDEGTIGQRLSDLKGKVVLKTGTHRSVTALAGYVTTKEGNVLAYAIMVNGFFDEGKVVYKKPFRQMEDQIVQRLAEVS